MSTEISEVKKSKEQIDKENEIAAIVKGQEEAGACCCMEECVSKILMTKEAKKAVAKGTDSCPKDLVCKCPDCMDAALGATSSYVRMLSKPPYTDWSGVLTVSATSIYADSLTEFRPEKIKEGDDKEVKDKIMEKNQKKGKKFVHKGQEMIRGYWMSPAPEFWLGRLVC
jgi:hypothetical protein